MLLSCVCTCCVFACTKDTEQDDTADVGVDDDTLTPAVSLYEVSSTRLQSTSHFLTSSSLPEVHVSALRQRAIFIARFLRQMLHNINIIRCNKCIVSWLNVVDVTECLGHS